MLIACTNPHTLTHATGAATGQLLNTLHTPAMSYHGHKQMNRFTQWSVISFLFSGYQVRTHAQANLLVVCGTASQALGARLPDWTGAYVCWCADTSTDTPVSMLCCAVGVQQPCVQRLHALPHPGAASTALQLEL